MRTFSGLALVAAATVLLALSTLVAVNEAGPFLLRVAPLEARIDTISATTGDPTPVSILESQYARTVRLDVCLSTLRDLLATQAHSFTVATAVTRGCLAIAEAIVARSPLESNAWFIAATLSARLGDFARAEDYLDQSYRTGPSEQWIVERRALFAYALRDKFSNALGAKIDKDLALLLRTERGVRVLATRYVSDPTMREHLVNIAETLDRDTQERFFAHIKTDIQDRK